jgi:hypothetical protein
VSPEFLPLEIDEIESLIKEKGFLLQCPSLLKFIRLKD